MQRPASANRRRTLIAMLATFLLFAGMPVSVPVATQVRTASAATIVNFAGVWEGHQLAYDYGECYPVYVEDEPCTPEPVRLIITQTGDTLTIEYDYLANGSIDLAYTATVSDNSFTGEGLAFGFQIVTIFGTLASGTLTGTAEWDAGCPGGCYYEYSVTGGGGDPIPPPTASAVIGTQDDVLPAIETSILELKSVYGIACSSNSPDCTYQWFRSSGQSDGDYQPSADSDPATPPEQYNLDENPQNDVGHHFFLRIIDADGTQADSNVIVVERCALLIVPGVAGTYAADTGNDLGWLLNRGVAPNQLQIDPLGRVYHDLIQTLENVGYVQGEDLFVANYDWRLPPGPVDGTIDGTIQGLSGASLTDTTYQYSVDYLGHFLREAVEAHEVDAPDARLGCVDIIAHSTGGLVARSYIQSPAYQDTFSSANGERSLPRVNEFIMIGVPNRGASKAWNPLHDNWVIDPVYRIVLSKIVNRAYQKVLQGTTIEGPDHDINLASIDDGQGNPDPLAFIEQYAPTIKTLLATYDFIDFGSGFTNVNSDPEWRNLLVLDLNDGLDLHATADPSPFADQSTVTVIYSGSHATATSVGKQIGAAGGADAILPFTDFAANDAQPGETWYRDIVAPAGGDGTVPLDSAIGQFVGDERVTLKPFSADHTGLVGNPAVQTTILETLRVTFETGDIATGTAAGTTALSVIFDPVEGFVVDGNGRRLGYSQTTGPVTEIPGSLWFGNSDGFGLVTAPLVEPLRLELTGLGEPYYVQVTFEHEGQQGGITAAGFLGEGETLVLPIELVNLEPEDTHYQACLFAGALSQVNAIGASMVATNTCGRGVAIVLLGGEDLFACLFAGSLTQIGATQPLCGRGEPVGFADGTDYHGCRYAGSLSQVGTTKPSSCGRGAFAGFSGPRDR